MKLLVACLFVCLVSVYTAPLDRENTDSIPLRHLRGVVSNETTNNGKKDDPSDPQPAEERLTPAKGKFEGDILLTPEQKKKIKDADKNVEKRGVGLASSYFNRWPGNKVYYKLDLSLYYPARKAIEEAMEDWEKYTCTRFIQGESPMGHYIRIFAGSGCYSRLGYVKEAGQLLSIGFGCEQKGTVMHELAHAQGILHEQSRFDRDNYVTIMYENIISSAKKSFDKHRGSVSGGFPYDYGSIMHYGDKAFSKNGQPTIVTKTGAPIGQRLGFSSKDITFANAFLFCSPQLAAPWTSETRKDKWPQSKCNYYKSVNYCMFPRYRKKCAKTCA